VKIADRSEFEWDAANEYCSDDLASDSEDEKRIKRAETTASKKKEKGRMKRRKGRGRALTPQIRVPALASFFEAPTIPEPLTLGTSASVAGVLAIGMTRLVSLTLRFTPTLSYVRGQQAYLIKRRLREGS